MGIFQRWTFESGTQGWGSSNAGTAQSTGWSSEGTHSLLVTATSGAAGAGYFNATSPGGTSGIPVTPGQTLTVYADVEAPQALTSMYVQINWLNSSGTFVSKVNAAGIAMVTGQVATLVLSNAQVPSGISYAQVIVQENHGDATGTAFSVDNVQVIQNVINLCTNPSFNTDLTGWNPLSGAQLAQDQTYVAVGTASMLVTTPGSVVGEGFTGPVATNGAVATTGAVGLSFNSPQTGTLTFEVIDANTQVVLASSTVSLDGDSLWDQRPTLTFSVAAGQSFQVEVTTTTVQALSFWVDAVQYETGVTTASPYIDGDQPGCVWLGTAEESASELLYPNATSASGFTSLTGRATPIGGSAPAVFTSASGKMRLTGDLQPGNANVPLGAFADFAIFGLTDPDPAMTYADQNNAGASTGQTNYASSYGIFVPPLDYPVSNGNYAWRRAAYMALGFYLTGVPAGNEQNVTDVQVALAPVGTTTPAAFTPPRQIVPIIKPTRLNFCTNPSFEVSAAGWSGVGTGTVAQDSTVVPPPAYETLMRVGNLPSSFNSVGITSDGSMGSGNIDSNGYSYSAQQLTLAGLGFGALVQSGGITYQMPTAPAGQADNIRAIGQTIPIGAPTGAGYIGFLGTAVDAGGSGASGTVTVTYTDGTTSTPTLAFTDWTMNGGGFTTPMFGNSVAATMPYRNSRTGTENTGKTYVFSAVLPLNTAKQVASITLPNQNLIHIFGISLAELAGSTYGSNSGKVTVHANGDGISMSVPDLVVGDKYTVSFLTQAGAGLSALTAAAGAAIPGIAGSGSGSVSNSGADLLTNVWYTPSFSFQATSSTAQVLSIAATTAADFVTPSSFWVDAVLIEAGEIVNPYFDGSFGTADYQDYQWESTAGLSRSYYYAQLNVKKYSIAQILSQHTPLGISAAAPQYLVPYTQ